MPRLPLVSAIILLVAVHTSAQVPELINWQAHLTEEGTPLEGAVNLIIRLYDAKAGGQVVFTKDTTGVVAQQGVVSVPLGPLTDVDVNRALFVGVRVNGGSELEPRTPLTSVPYALGMRGMRTVPVDDGYRFGVSVIGGLAQNKIGENVLGATIAGGGVHDYSDGYFDINEANGSFGAVGGGAANRADGSHAVVGGGYGNVASGAYATVAGGRLNQARGMYSFAAGHRARAAHQKTFVWNDGSGFPADSLVSSAVGQFLIRAAGGVGIGVAEPETQLDVAGHVSIHPGGVFGEGGQLSLLDGDGLGGWEIDNFGTDGYEQLRFFRDRGYNNVASALVLDNTGRIGIGTNNPVNRLSVSGQADFTGNVGIGTTGPLAALAVDGIDDGASGPMIMLGGKQLNQLESGRIRLVEGAASTGFRGAYIHYDGSANRLYIGDHPGSDVIAANDVNLVSVERGTGHVGIGRDDPAYPLHVGSTTSNGNGAHVTAGGEWVNGSSRTFKEGFEPIDVEAILAQLAALPISRWRYKGEHDARHIGPVAEDFYATFGLGSDERYIGTVDADGVALAAIQGLYDQLLDERARNDDLEARLAEMGKGLSHLQALVERLIDDRPTP